MRTQLLCLLALLALFGCASEESYDLVPTSGKVTLNGEPLADARVSFQPVASSEAPNPGPGSTAVTDDAGNYTLTTGGEQEGAVVGKHQVRIFTGKYETSDPASDDPDATKTVAEEILPPRYNFQTELTFDVPAGGTDQANFELESP